MLEVEAQGYFVGVVFTTLWQIELVEEAFVEVMFVEVLLMKVALLEV